MTAIDRAFTNAFMLRDLAFRGAAADSAGPLPPADLRSEPSGTRVSDAPSNPPVSEVHEAEAQVQTEVQIEVQAEVQTEVQAEVETPVDSPPDDTDALADATPPDAEPP